jgi:mRNA interferase MazF
MKQGEIWHAALNPIEGSEQAGNRPVVIVSGNLLNEYAPVLWICPLTTKLKRYHGNLILIPSKTNGLQKESEVLTLHIRSISKLRLKKRIGKISGNEIDSIHQTISEIMKF